MRCTLEVLRQKDVINIVNGENLGRVDDLELDGETAAVHALILYGKPRFFGIFGPRENCVISFRQIRLIGVDTILVEWDNSGSCTVCTKQSDKSTEKIYMQKLDPK
ncbi:YlmC/YmxH family sporulation protein [Ruminococcus sp.]|uniref:YlmC/YmxH family sporulation protein n=1 Tax=Ruminococcus sp. TaxID=41978 RepID=UPI003A8CF8AA